jgi:hypothetical protein
MDPTCLFSLVIVNIHLKLTVGELMTFNSVSRRLVPLLTDLEYDAESAELSIPWGKRKRQAFTDCKSIITLEEGK